MEQDPPEEDLVRVRQEAVVEVVLVVVVARVADRDEDRDEDRDAEWAEAQVVAAGAAV